MTEATNFSDLVREAFIDPLRSVLIVDDQYPTWGDILDETLHDRSKAKTWRSAPNEPLGVIKQFRERKPGMVIDIHDALAPINAGQADHLHQSDLLVLDYNLEGEQSGLGGAKAREILQSVLSNRHFNLVVVHTGEDRLEDVFFDCLLATMTSCTNQFDDNVISDLEALDTILNDLEAEEKFDRGSLPEVFDQREYLLLREPSTVCKTLIRPFMKGQGQFNKLSAWGHDIGLEGKDLKTFFFWAIREFEKQKLPIFASENFEGLTWNSEDGCIWLRTTKGFVTFVAKGPDDLLEALQKALENWQPTPSRLISAKYRHELSSVGVEAEDRTLLRSHVFAHFYKDFFFEPRPDLPDEEQNRLRVAKLKEHVSRQSEAVSSHIENKVVEFGEKIRTIDIDTGETFASHYGVDLSDAASADTKKAITHYNSYVSTLPLKEGDDQLDSGYIFEMNNEWWVCATPACDLQPGQNTTAFIGSSSTHRPFTALKLEKVCEEKALKNAQSGLNCFVEQSPRDVVCLTFDPSENGKATWRTFIAKNNGCISDKKMDLIALKFNGEGAPILEDGKKAKLIAKLRYEYALNYIQKVGTSVSRIGLGYCSSEGKASLAAEKCD